MASNVFPTQVVSAFGSIRAGKPIPTTDVDPEQNECDRQELLRALPMNKHLERFRIDTTGASGVFYLTREHYENIQKLHDALDKAAVDVVERWYGDEKAGFPQRMPLTEKEDELLRWIYGPGSKVVPSFRKHRGNWRPDYLVEKTVLPDGSTIDNPVVCEINARMPWNGFALMAYLGQAFKAKGIAKGGLKPGYSMDSFYSTIEQFDPTKPLHFVNEKFPLRDPPWIADIFGEKTGQMTRFLKPSDLKLLPDEESDAAYAVFCPTKDGTGVERIYQVGLELTQDEYEQIDPEILRKLAPHCVNDLRSVFLVNDQRFLGIIYEEVGNQVHRGILTAEEADLLRRGVAPSFLPSSTTWTKVIEVSKHDPTVKDKWVLKYARSGLGEGHVFGKVVSNEEWLEKLAAAQGSNSTPEQGSYVLQKYIEQMDFDVLHHLAKKVIRQHAIGTWHSCNGRFLGPGSMRLAGLTVFPLMSDEGYGVITCTAV